MLHSIKLCTKNLKKINEFSKLLPSVQIITKDLTGKNIVLDEIQSFNPKKVISHKLFQLSQYSLLPNSIYLVEDTSLFSDALNGYPGPYIKDFINTIGINKFSQLCHGPATIQTYIGAMHIKSNGLHSTQIFCGEQKCRVNHIYLTDAPNDYDYVVSAEDTTCVFQDDQTTKLHRKNAIDQFCISLSHI